jgi:hypothetical protein
MKILVLFIKQTKHTSLQKVELWKTFKYDKKKSYTLCVENKYV